MFISSLTDRGATPALELMWSFTQQRHTMIAENVANWGVPDYKTKRVDARAFQQELGRALKERSGDPSRSLQVRAGDQFRTVQSGRLELTPTVRPPDSILFHDGTNLSIDRQMSDLAENAMMHESVTTLLRGRYEGLRKAIRGRA
ncbi:MAG: hypothetical protein GY778_21825 [bacterium]|nr:hypothetical protein [bacterium]